MSKFKITPQDTKEYHCRQALKAFDPSCVITLDKEDLVVETNKLDYETIKSLTSVKDVTNLDNELIINWASYVVPNNIYVNSPPRKILYNNLYGNISNGNTFNNNTILNTNPNNTCLTFSEVKTKIRNLLQSHLYHINFSSGINLFDNVSNLNYIIPQSDPNSRVIDILHSNNDIYDHELCKVRITLSTICLDFTGNKAINVIAYKNVIDVYESTPGIVTIVYV